MPGLGERARIANVAHNGRSKSHLEAVCTMFTPATTPITGRRRGWKEEGERQPVTAQ